LNSGDGGAEPDTAQHDEQREQNGAAENADHAELGDQRESCRRDRTEGQRRDENTFASQ
jgi:hypothetical protein